MICQSVRGQSVHYPMSFLVLYDWHEGSNQELEKCMARAVMSRRCRKGDERNLTGGGVAVPGRKVVSSHVDSSALVHTSSSQPPWEKCLERLVKQ